MFWFDYPNGIGLYKLADLQINFHSSAQQSFNGQCWLRLLSLLGWLTSNKILFKSLSQILSILVVRQIFSPPLKKLSKTPAALLMQIVELRHWNGFFFQSYDIPTALSLINPLLLNMKHLNCCTNIVSTAGTLPCISIIFVNQAIAFSKRLILIRPPFVVISITNVLLVINATRAYNRSAIDQWKFVSAMLLGFDQTYIHYNGGMTCLTTSIKKLTFEYHERLSSSVVELWRETKHF